MAQLLWLPSQFRIPVETNKFNAARSKMDEEQQQGEREKPRRMEYNE